MFTDEKPAARAGLVGCGTVALRGLIPGWMPNDHPLRPTPVSFLEFGGSEALSITSLYDPNRRHVLKAHRLLPDAHICRSWTEMRKLKTNLDAIIVAAPNHLHEGIVLDALEDGHDVFVEKPLALTHEGLVRICDLSEKKESIVMVNLAWRFSPIAHGLFEAVKSGIIGSVLLVQGEFRHAGPKSWAPTARWYLSDKNPGGSLTDLGPHLFDMMVTIVGASVHQIICRGSSKSGCQRAECDLSFDSGAKGQAVVGWDASAPIFQIFVTGTKGMLCAVLAGYRKGIFFSLDSYEVALTVSGSFEIVEKDKPTWSSIPLPDKPPENGPFAHFISCIQTRRQPITAATKVRVTESLVIDARSQL